MASFNRITLVGIVEKDPRKKKRPKEVEFPISVERYVSKGKKPIVDIFTCVATEKLSESIMENVKKGSKVMLNGNIRIQTRMIKGERTWSTDIVIEDLKYLSNTTMEA